MRHRWLIVLMTALAATGAPPAAAFVKRAPVVPAARIFPPGLLAAMLAVPVPNLDYHVGLVDATGVALGTAANPLSIAAGTVPGTMNVQGVSGAGVSIVGTNPLVLGVADSGNLARFLLSASSGADNISATNSFLSGLIAINAASTWDRIRTTPGATATTGTGLLGTGPLLWDTVGATNFVKQAGDGSGRALVVGAGANQAAVAGNPNWIAGSTTAAGGNLQGLVVESAAQPNLRTSIWNAALEANLTSGGDAQSNNYVGLITQGFASDFNGVGWDRHRNNIDAIIQASTATTVQTINTDIVTYNAGKLLVHINVTNFNAGNLTVKLQWKDANGLFMDIPLLTTGALSAGGPDFLLCLGPNVWPANTATAFYANFPVPRSVRVIETIAAATVTFSSAYSTNMN